MSTKVQLQEVNDKLAQLDPNNRDHLVEIARLNAQKVELTNQVAQEEAAQLRIQEAAEQAAYFLDTLDVEGLTMRELCVDEASYQLLRIAVQNKLVDDAEKNSKQISEIQVEEAFQQNALKQQIEQLQAEKRDANEDAETIKQLQSELSQAKLEVTDYQNRLKNATDEIDRLNSQVDDLRKEIAVGARNAYKVTDVEQQAQMKELAEKIKASRIHVYDVVPDSLINPKNYTAKRADTGEEVTYNWTQVKNYIEIKDAAEVERFRNEHQSNQEANADSLLGNEETTDVTPEVTFPELPQAQAPNIPGEIPVVVGTPESSGQGKTVEERLNALEKRVVELEKVCNINEEAA